MYIVLPVRNYSQMERHLLLQRPLDVELEGTEILTSECYDAVRNGEHIFRCDSEYRSLPNYEYFVFRIDNPSMVNQIRRADLFTDRALSIADVVKEDLDVPEDPLIIYSGRSRDDWNSKEFCITITTYAPWIANAKLPGLEHRLDEQICIYHNGKYYESHVGQGNEGSDEDESLALYMSMATIKRMPICVRATYKDATSIAIKRTQCCTLKELLRCLVRASKKETVRLTVFSSDNFPMIRKMHDSILYRVLQKIEKMRDDNRRDVIVMLLGKYHLQTRALPYSMYLTF